MDTVSFGSLLCICYLIVLAPVSILALWSFCILRNVTEISARRPQSAILAGAFCIIFFAIDAPFCLAVYNSEFIPIFDYCNVLTNLASMIVLMGPPHIFTYRSYMVYFDIKWNVAMAEQSCRYIYSVSVRNPIDGHAQKIQGVCTSTRSKPTGFCASAAPGALSAELPGCSLRTGRSGSCSTQCCP